MCYNKENNRCTAAEKAVFMSKLTICCPCLFGLESVLSGEIRRMGGENIVTTDGKVTFEGDFSMVICANIYLRTAERVLIQLGSFPAYTFTDLFDGVAALPLEDFIGSLDAFPVKGWSLNSQLRSVPDCQSIIKKAAVKRLGEVYGKSWFEETGPARQIQFSIHKDQASIYLDTSGQGLHKRGYRRNSTLAPIKETLAAGIIDLAHVRRDDLVIDPFCGSGTFIIEAGLHALKIAPGMRRRFAAEQWGVVPDSQWMQVRQEAREGIYKQAQYRGIGSDIDYEAVQLSADNAQKAGIASRVQFQRRNIAEFEVPEQKATVICNPPYGERLLEIKQAEELYRTMGRVFRRREGVSYYIISPHEEFEKLFGRKADKRRKLYNGMIKCQLFMYFQ